MLYAFIILMMSNEFYVCIPVLVLVRYNQENVPVSNIRNNNSESFTGPNVKKNLIHFTRKIM